MNEELKPVRCGCGGEATCYLAHYWGKSFTVRCSRCGTETKPYDTEAEAIKAWNKAMGADTNSVVSVFSSEVNDESDLIDRQLVIDGLSELVSRLKFVQGDLGGAVSGVREYIKTLPSVEPERKKGKWIDGKPYVNSHWWVCSVCHVPAPENHTGYNFCPHCGADMRGKE